MLQIHIAATRISAGGKDSNLAGLGSRSLPFHEPLFRCSISCPMPSLSFPAQKYQVNIWWRYFEVAQSCFAHSSYIRIPAVLLLKNILEWTSIRKGEALGQPTPPKPVACEIARWQETFGLCCWQYALSRGPGVRLHYSAVSFLLVK